jgi:hypothetical protein
LRRSRENFPKLHFRTDRNYPLPGAKLPGARSPAATIVNEELTPVHPNLCLLKLQINFSALYQYQTVEKSDIGRSFSAGEEDVMTVAALRRFAGDRKGNVAIIFAFSLMPIVLLTGMGIDYTSATTKKAMIDAAADAAPRA